VSAFLAAWFGFVALFQVLFVALALDPGTSPPPSPTAMALAPLVFYAFGAGLVALIRTMARAG
jgi:hypothetical protein